MPAKPLPAPRRRWLPLLAVLAAVLLAAPFALRLVLLHQLEQGLARQAEAWRAQGVTLAHGEPQRLPEWRAAALRLPAVRIASADGTAWEAEAVTLRLDLPWPDALRLEAVGAMALTLSGQRLPLAAEALHGVVPLAGGPARLEGQALRLETPTGGLTLGRLTARLGQGAGPQPLEFDAQALTLPAPPRPGLAATLDRLALAATAEPLPAAQGSPRRRAAAWQAHGGRLAVQRALLHWGPLRAEAEAGLRLDAGLQPEGRGTLRVAGLPETMDLLMTAGLLDPRQGRLARFTVAALQRAPAEGGPPRLEVPLEFGGGQLRLAGFRLPLPALDWGAE